MLIQHSRYSYLKLQTFRFSLIDGMFENTKVHDF